MTTRHAIPAEVLAQHIAVLGKTGSGKTSTAKLAIEQVVAEGARVCVLDPIKSDWWGLTSSTDGKRGGLPFHILGGPHGHVPLHSAAGKAIADVVATGALPLSIIDMADFEPGGQAKFFVDFAPTLLRKMRGVVYLVIEEAHLFAPKERSGIGAENLSIHWAKTMATAGRSKGVRLVLVTQRTQALHNALLGSCDTLIAHRLTAPADQEPVVKWLKANTSKEVLEVVSGSLASLKTGEGWICSGEAKLFDRYFFPRIKTYDNTATPTGDSETREIKTAAVDPEKLRAIIGEAVDKAKQDDPRELRKQIAELKKHVPPADNIKCPACGKPPMTKDFFLPYTCPHCKAGVLKWLKKDDPMGPARDKPVLTDADRALVASLGAKLDQVVERLTKGRREVLQEAFASIEATLASFKADVFDASVRSEKVLVEFLEQKGFQKILGKLASVPNPQRPAVTTTRQTTRQAFPAQASRSVSRPSAPPVVGDGTLTGPERKILTAIAELEVLGLYPADKQQVGLMANYTNVRSGGFSEPLGRLIANGYAESPQTGTLIITDAGRAQVTVDDAPTSPLEMQVRVMAKLSGPEQRILGVAIDAYPNALDKEDVAARCDPPYTNIRSGGFSEPLGRLVTLGLLHTPRKGAVKASPALFLERA